MFLTNTDLNKLDKRIRTVIEDLFDIFIYNVNAGNIEIRALINRQPTLWIYSIMGYKVKINTDREDYTLKIHPLITTSYNADFDGDSAVAFTQLKIYDKTNKIWHEIKINLKDLKDLEL